MDKHIIRENAGKLWRLLKKKKKEKRKRKGKEGIKNVEVAREKGRTRRKS